MREGVIADRIAKKVPSQHWLPIAVVAGITLVFVTKYTLEAVVAVANAERRVSEIEGPGLPATPGETDEVVIDPVAESDNTDEQRQPTAQADSTVGNASETGMGDESTPSAADRPTADKPKTERMVAEWMVRFVVDNLHRKDDFWKEIIQSRDEQVSSLSQQLAQLRGQLSDQSKEILAMRQEQVEAAWAQVDRFRQEAALGTRVQSNEFQVGEQDNGISDIPSADPFGGVQQVQPETRQSPVRTVVAQREPAVVSRDTRVNKTRRRSGYLNVNPRRESISNGPAAGSASARLRGQKIYRNGVVGWSRRYYHGRSAGLRMLQEAERGNR